MSKLEENMGSGKFVGYLKYSQKRTVGTVEYDCTYEVFTGQSKDIKNIESLIDDQIASVCRSGAKIISASILQEKISTETISPSLPSLGSIQQEQEKISKETISPPPSSRASIAKHHKKPKKREGFRSDTESLPKEESGSE